MAKLNLGAVTAYADAVKAGFTGTREEFGEWLANAGKNAAEVAANLEESKKVLASVNTAGETQVKAVQDEGSAQVKAVEDAAEAQKQKIADLDAVQFTAQDKTDEEKAVARKNIDAASADEVDEISQQIEDFSGRVNSDYYTESSEYIPVTLTPLVGSATYCYWRNSSSNKLNQESSDTISYNGHEAIPVKYGEEYKLSNVRTGSENYLRAWFVVDEEFNVVASADKGTDSDYHDFDVVVPDGGKYLCIIEHNVLKATLHKKNIIFTPTIKELEEEIGDVTETAYTRNLFDSDALLEAEGCTKSEDGVYSVTGRNLSALGLLFSNFEKGKYTLSLTAKTDAVSAKIEVPKKAPRNTEGDKRKKP